MNLIIRESIISDLEKVINLLTVNQLPTIDIIDSNVKLFVSLHNSEIVGVIGLERYNNIALLRSLAVKDEFKNQKIGRMLVDFLVNFSSCEQITDLYLLTTTAERYFYKFGFHKIDRFKVPEIIIQTREFSDICPTSAIVMLKKHK